MSDLRAAARILAFGTAPGVVAEVARDSMRRLTVPELLQLGRAMGDNRQEKDPELRAVQKAVLDAANEGQAAAALALAAGMAGRNKDGGVAAKLLNESAQSLYPSMLVAIGTEAVPVVAAARLDVRRVLMRAALDPARAAGDLARAPLIAHLLAALAEADGVWAAEQVHSVAEETLVAAECGVGVRAEWALVLVHAMTAALDFGGSWVAAADTLAKLHFVLEPLGQPDAVRQLSTRLVHWVSDRPERADACVRALFTANPSLQQVNVRGPVALFTMDILEHLVPYVGRRCTEFVVMPLAARYAEQGEAGVGSRLFESAHALILTCLERQGPALADVVPWYTHILLAQYPAAGISVDLLRIAYAAAVRAADRAVAAESISGLERRLDEYGPSSVVSNTRRRELLCVLVDLLAVAPLSLLPRVMSSVESRALTEPEWATRKLLADEVQDVVLTKCDIVRKPALAQWSWNLRTRLNETIDAKI
ncbi:hypothetical protein GGF46_004761 [Coemansia sp. RSA 552]|nr:hypothetical protein GGF46_004761 [Coemansia sp. RSA 552]